MDNFPWQKILDYLAETGNESDPAGFYEKAAQGLAGIVPYDSVFIMFRDPNYNLLPKSYGIEIPDKAQIEYKQYYDRIDCCRFNTSPGAPLSYADWSWEVFRNNEFYQDFIKPLHYTSSMGVNLWTRDNHLEVAIGFNRSGRVLNEQELAIFAVIQPHLKNLYNLQKTIFDLKISFINPLEVREKCRLLSKREAEVTALLLQRLTMAEVATKLLISPRTVQTYVENIKEKLGVRNRRELMRMLIK